MHGTIPEITPRLTQAETANGPKLGSCVEFGPKLKYLMAQGAFGPNVTQRSLAGLMYVPQSWLEKPVQPEHNVRINSAYRRIENLCKPADKSMLKQELDFLRSGFNRLFGDYAVGMISDQQLLGSTLQSLVSQLMGTEVTLNLELIDPVLAIEAMATFDPDEISIEIDRSNPMRWISQANGVTLANDLDPIETIKQCP